MLNQLNPHISVDCVVFGYDVTGLKVLLVEREVALAGSLDEAKTKANTKTNSKTKTETKPETKTDLKLPGSLVYNDELLDDAASRVLKELTGLGNIFLERFDVLDSLDRMKDQVDKEWLETTTGLTIDRVISFAYYGLVNLTDDKPANLSESSQWVAIELVNQLPFDHSKIISHARDLLSQRVKTDTIAFDLLPRKFSILQLQQMFQVFYGSKIDSRNFRKKLKSFTFIIPLEEKQNKVAHKPARLYKFDKKRFMQFKIEKTLSMI